MPVYGQTQLEATRASKLALIQTHHNRPKKTRRPSRVKKVEQEKEPLQSPSDNSDTLVRFHIAVDAMGNFSYSGGDPSNVITTGDVGVHAGINLKGSNIEWSFFTGPEISLNLPITHPFAKTWMVGTELTGEIAEPLRWALQIGVSWQWYNQLVRNNNGELIQWSPAVQIPIQAGLEIVLVEGKRSELSLQALCGIAPGWSTGAWSVTGICSGALHANL